MPRTYTPQQIRKMAAELAILKRFDSNRGISGHDYGAGQRSAELWRRQRELKPYICDGSASSIDFYKAIDALELTAEELREAFNRVGRPRLERITGSENFRRDTPSSRRTVRSWERLRDIYAPELDAPAGEPMRAAAESQVELPPASTAEVLERIELTNAGRQVAEEELEGFGSVLAKVALELAGTEDWSEEHRATAVRLANEEGARREAAKAERPVEELTNYELVTRVAQDAWDLEALEELTRRAQEARPAVLDAREETIAQAEAASTTVEELETEPVAVRIIGPNLNDQTRGTFHVHADGCAHLKQYGPGRRQGGELNGEDEMLVSVRTPVEVVLAVYADHLAESPGTEPEEWLSDFYFAPCVKGI